MLETIAIVIVILYLSRNYLLAIVLTSMEHYHKFIDSFNNMAAFSLFSTSSYITSPP